MVSQNIIIPIKEEKKKPKIKEAKEKIAEIKAETKDSKPDEIHHKQCRILHVKKVTGPKEITIGESAIYEITQYNRTDLTNAEKKRVKWKVGLDKNDIKAGELGMIFEPFKFLSWFYLQRVRGYKPFRTKIQYTDIIEGDL